MDICLVIIQFLDKHLESFRHTNVDFTPVFFYALKFLNVSILLEPPKQVISKINRMCFTRLNFLDAEG